MPRKKSGTFDNKRYQNEYHKAMKTMILSFNPNNPEDMKLWEHLQAQQNRTGYIKHLIREQITRDLEHSWYELDEQKKKAEQIKIPAIDGYRDEEAIKAAEDGGHRIYHYMSGPWAAVIDLDDMKVLTVNRLYPEITGI